MVGLEYHQNDGVGRIRVAYPIICQLVCLPGLQAAEPNAGAGFGGLAESRRRERSESALSGPVVPRKSRGLRLVQSGGDSVKDVTPSKRVGGVSRRVSGNSGWKRTTGAWWYSSGLSGCGDASRDTVEGHLTLGGGH